MRGLQSPEMRRSLGNNHADSGNSTRKTDKEILVLEVSFVEAWFLMYGFSWPFYTWNASWNRCVSSFRLLFVLVRACPGNQNSKLSRRHFFSWTEWFSSPLQQSTHWFETPILKVFSSSKTSRVQTTTRWNRKFNVHFIRDCTFTIPFFLLSSVEVQDIMIQKRSLT